MQVTKEVLIIAGITVIVASVVGAVFGGGMINDVQNERLEIISSEIKSGSSGSSIISISIKNMGGHNVTNITGEINYDYDDSTVGLQPFPITFTPTELAPGGVIGANAYMADISDSEIRLSSGSSYVIIVKGVTANGNPIQDTATVYVTSGF